MIGLHCATRGNAGAAGENDLPAIQQALCRDIVVLDMESVTYNWPIPEPGQEWTFGQIDRRK
jgi:hypothetical protein